MEPLSPLDPLCSRLPSRICSEGCIVSPLLALPVKRLQTHNPRGKLFPGPTPACPATPLPLPTPARLTRLTEVVCSWD